MSHIASHEFYQQKQEKISLYAHSGAVIMVEGVGTGTTENTEKFYEALSFRLTETLYDRMASFL